MGYGAKFEGIPILPHGLRGIFISDKAIIGKNVTIYQQTCIGVQGAGKHEAPTIKDGCIIGTGAKILGGITVGENAKIGANAVVVFDVPDNATVVLEKPRVLLKKPASDVYE